MIEIFNELYHPSKIILCRKISYAFTVHSTSRVEIKYGLELHYDNRSFFVFPAKYAFYFDSEAERDEKYNEIKEVKWKN